MVQFAAMKCPDCAASVPVESPWCPSCGASLEEDGFAKTRLLDSASKPSEGRDAPQGEAPTRMSTNPPMHSSASPLQTRPSSRSSRSHSSIHESSIDNARFVPGTILAERYRIVGLLGRGGMGEVYRAEDLKLEQPVALKLLPDALSSDGVALARFHREVRIARQISHRNVCRVYDIGEAEGLHFLSMEYIRGEELSSVIKRFGRLPADKAADIARQICAGLAAAHDAGVLHRELKPSNVMIDDRGDVRITDFGLAGLTEDFRGSVALEGTPEYMSPEQLEGRELTVRSDIYSLGLVLYELFTGKKAFTAATLPDLLRLRRSDTLPESPTTLVKDLDPLVERVIDRCLAREPKDRPASALQVAAALPGGDPLAAALAAGETPSPEMVAAAPTEGALRPPVAMLLLAGAIVALAVSLALSGRAFLHRRVPLERSAVGLKERAGEVARKLGYAEASDSAHGFYVDEEYLNEIKKTDQSAARWERLRAGQPAAIYFWYRQSPYPLMPYNGRAVSSGDPPRITSGMTGVFLDTRGRLISFYGVPPQVNEPLPAGATSEYDWGPVFSEAGFDLSKFTPVEPKWLPPYPYDELRAWDGVYPEQPSMSLQVQAAAFRGKPVYFHIVDPWNTPTRQQRSTPSWQARMVQTILLVSFTVIVLGAALLARRNLKLGRGDRRGASRLALVVFVLNMVAWLFSAHHVLSISDEFYMLIVSIAWSLMTAGLIWLVYVALEPFVRRRWPHRIIGWNRLLAGDWRDPIVGRDILLGAFFGFSIMLIDSLSNFVPQLLGLPPTTPGIHAFALASLHGTQQAIPNIISQLINSFVVPTGLLFMLLLFSFVLRREWLAAGVLGLILTVLGALSGEHPRIDWAFAVMSAALTLFILLRFGMLAMIATQFFLFLFLFFPVTTDFSAWYAGPFIIGLAFSLALTGLAFYTSLGGRPLFQGKLIDD
ncbi:MAG TPA: serine/threonine-protein kinase [Pyrinomonadaceae bacterium]|nr:serine/threonine-protein kinase [Pyrinomonadaceae bacterium]